MFVSLFNVYTLLQSPKRALNLNHINRCKGYGLSLFDTSEGAIDRYQELIASKPNLIETLGNSLGEINLSFEDGIGSEPETNNNGHFTFHEYQKADLAKKIFQIQSPSLEVPPQYQRPKAMKTACSWLLGVDTEGSKALCAA